MAAVVSPIRARVEHISKPKPSKHQEGSYYYAVLFLDQSKSGDDAKIWKSLSGDEVSQVMVGDLVDLVPAGKTPKGEDKHNLVLVSAATQQQAEKPQQTKEERKAEICRYVESLADLLVFCRQTAIAKLGPDTDEETIRCSTQALLIQTCKKFSL